MVARSALYKPKDIRIIDTSLLKGYHDLISYFGHKNFGFRDERCYDSGPYILCAAYTWATYSNPSFLIGVLVIKNNSEYNAVYEMLLHCGGLPLSYEAYFQSLTAGHFPFYGQYDHMAKADERKDSLSPANGLRNPAYHELAAVVTAGAGDFIENRVWSSRQRIHQIGACIPVGSFVRKILGIHRLQFTDRIRAALSERAGIPL